VVEMGLGPSLPPAELVRQDSALFVEVKCIFSATPVAEIFSKSSWIETKANGGHWGDRTLYQTRSWLDRTRPVSGSCCAWRGALGFTTGTSGPSRDRRVRSSPRKIAKSARSIRRYGASCHDRPDASDRERELTRNDRTLALWRSIRLEACPVAVSRARALCDRRVRSHLPESVTFRDRWKSNERDSKRDTWRALA
jgi:hypothetical protein